jgi:hypothetical protein
MAEFMKFLDEKIDDRMRKEYPDTKLIAQKLTAFGFQPDRMKSKIASVVNQIALENRIGASDISIDYQAHPDHPDRKVLYINTYGMKNSVFLDINNDNPDTSIIKV